MRAWALNGGKQNIIRMNKFWAPDRPCDKFFTVEVNICVGTQCRFCFISSFRRLEFWSSPRSLKELNLPADSTVVSTLGRVVTEVALRSSLLQDCCPLCDVGCCGLRPVCEVCSPPVAAHSGVPCHSVWLPAGRILHLCGRHARRHPGYGGESAHEVPFVRTSR